MSGYWLEMLNFGLRWLHLIAGIAWIGSSFYFMWLDYSLERKPGLVKGIAGELWAVHGGGFYHKRKFMSAPEEMPEKLHWFKWEAYTTWLSGFALFVLLYWWQWQVYLVDDYQQSSALEAIGLSAAGLLGGWLIYDLLCRFLFRGNSWLLAVILLILLSVGAYGYSEIYSGRGTYIQIGAIIGTIMAGNVLMVIIPNQRKTVAAMLRGEQPDSKYGQMGKMRSTHNNYLTLPVLFIMISNHFPALTGHSYNWLILLALSASAALIRHHFNLKNQRKPQHWLLPLGITLVVVVMVLAQPKPVVVEAGAIAVSDQQALVIAQQRCASCHSKQPTQPGFVSPPSGLLLDNLSSLRLHKNAIQAQAINSEIMPPGNLTGMTTDERDQLAVWLTQQN